MDWEVVDGAGCSSVEACEGEDEEAKHFDARGRRRPSYELGGGEVKGEPYSAESYVGAGVGCC